MHVGQPVLDIITTQPNGTTKPSNDDDDDDNNNKTLKFEKGKKRARGMGVVVKYKRKNTKWEPDGSS